MSDATLGLDIWVQRCDFGDRKINLYAKGNALMLHYSDGGEDEKLIETFETQADEKPEAAIKRVFTAHTSDKDLVARCLVKPYKGYGHVPKGAQRYTVLPNAGLKKELDAKTDPGDIPEPPCGDWGDMPDSVQYYEAQDGARRIMIVRGPRQCSMKKRYACCQLRSSVRDPATNRAPDFLRGLFIREVAQSSHRMR